MLSKFWKQTISLFLAITLFAQIIPLQSYADETLPAVVECDPQTGLSSLYEYSSVDIGKAGTAYLNTYLGTMHLRRSDLTLGGERMPVSVDFYYDPDNAAQSNPYGSGWFSSFNQILTYDQSSSRYGYKDENGTWIYFTNSGTFTEADDEIWVEDTQYGIGEVGMTLYLPADTAETSLASVDLAYGDTHYAFDNTGRLTRISSGANQTLISYASDTSLGISCVTDSVGRKFCFTYTDGYLSGIQCKKADDTVIPNTQVGYTVVDGCLTAVTYAADNVVSYGYDTSGRLISASGVDLCGYAFAYTESTDIVSSYTAKAAMGTAQEATGIQTTIQRAADGTVTVTEDTSQTAYTFDLCGRVASWELRTLSSAAAADLTGAQYHCLYGYTLTYGYVTQDDGTVTHTVVDVQTYDADGVIEEETESPEETTPGETTAPTEDPNAYTEDAYGNILTETYTEGGLKQTHSFTYSEDGNYLLSQTDENGNTVSYAYDLDSGLLEALTDANENTTEYSYNALRELQSVQLDVTGLRNATGMSAQYTYAQGRMTGLTYGGFQYGFTYDLWGNVTQVTMNSASLVSYDYGTAAHKGQVQTMTYGNGQQVFYSYNALGQVESVGYTGQLNRFQYTYDAEGALSQVYDAILEETTVYTENGYTVYNAANAVVYSHVSGDDDTSTEVVGIYTVQSTVGEDSVSSTIRRNGVSSGTVSAQTSYDALQRVDSNIYSVTGNEIAQYYSYATDASGNTGSLPESYTVTYTENDILYALNYQYQYDGNGNITSAAETLYKFVPYEETQSAAPEASPFTLPGDEAISPEAGTWQIVSSYTSTYGYDEAGQLVYAADTKTNRAYGYIYDASGNMCRQAVYDISSGEEVDIGWTAYTYDSHGALASSQKTGTGTAPINTVYQTDSMGNPISKTVGTTTSTYTWGEGRMLTGITTGSKSTTYTYNADGLRTSKTVTNGTSTSTTEYIWGSNGLAGVSQGLRKLLLLYDAEGSPIGFLMNGSPYTYVKNIQGDIIKILDMQGNAVVSYTYDPWGVPTAFGNATIAAINPCTYRGYDYDEDTGYFYLQSRYYDPKNCRFISVDDFPVLKHSDNLISGNLFCYCVNCAVNYIDHNGYWAQNYSGFKRTSYGFNVKYNKKFLGKPFCLSYAADIIDLYGSWSWKYGLSYKRMTAKRIAKELYAHAVLYCIGKGLLVTSLCNTVLNAIIKKLGNKSVLNSLSTVAQKINYIQYQLGYYLFDHSKVINVNYNEKWYRLIVFELIWVVL